MTPCTRHCRACGHVAAYPDDILPACACTNCGSADTSRIYPNSLKWPKCKCGAPAKCYSNIYNLSVFRCNNCCDGDDGTCKELPYAHGRQTTNIDGPKQLDATNRSVGYGSQRPEERRAAAAAEPADRPGRLCITATPTESVHLIIPGFAPVIIEVSAKTNLAISAHPQIRILRQKIDPANPTNPAHFNINGKENAQQSTA